MKLYHTETERIALIELAWTVGQHHHHAMGTMRFEELFSTRCLEVPHVVLENVSVS